MRLRRTSRVKRFDPVKAVEEEASRREAAKQTRSVGDKKSSSASRSRTTASPSQVLASQRSNVGSKRGARRSLARESVGKKRARTIPEKEMEGEPLPKASRVVSVPERWEGSRKAEFLRLVSLLRGSGCTDGILVYGVSGCGKSTLVSDACEASGNVWAKVRPQGLSRGCDLLTVLLGELARALAVHYGDLMVGKGSVGGVEKSGGGEGSGGDGRGEKIGIAAGVEDRVGELDDVAQESTEVLAIRAIQRFSILAGHSCSRFSEFARSVRTMLGIMHRVKGGRSKGVVLVIEDSHRVGMLDPTLTSSLLRLGELCRRPVTVVLVGPSPLAVLGSGLPNSSASATQTTAFLSHGARTPTFLYLPPPTIAEAVTIATSSSPPLPTHLTTHTARILRDVAGTNVREVRRAAALATSAIAEDDKEEGEEGEEEEGEEDEEGEDGEEEGGGTKEVHDDTKSILRAGPILSKARAAAWGGALPASGLDCHDLQLPFYSQILLLAVFLGSANHPDTDAQMFCKRGQGKRRKPRRSKTASSSSGSGGGGEGSGGAAEPNAVGWERAQMLFHTLDAAVEDAAHSRAAGTSDLGHAMATLVEAGLVERVEGPDPTFRCRLPPQDALALAKRVSIPVEDFLFQAHV